MSLHNIDYRTQRVEICVKKNAPTLGALLKLKFYSSLNK